MTETISQEALDGLLGLAERTANAYGMVCGIDNDEAFSLLGLEIAEYAHDYEILIRENNIGIIVNRFKRVLRQNARADKIRRLAEDCENRYEPAYVRLFLPFYFDRSDWANGPADEDSEGKPGWRTTDALDTALDIQRAFPALTDAQKAVIVSRHLTVGGGSVDGEEEWQAVADDLGYKNAETAQESYRRATLNLSVNMTEGRMARANEHDGPGSRKAMSIAASTAALSNNY
ncbi:hypothetical protein ACQPZJ_35585 [Actinoplanes sp. CA-054009]